MIRCIILSIKSVKYERYVLLYLEGVPPSARASVHSSVTIFRPALLGFFLAMHTTSGTPANLYSDEIYQNRI